MGADVREEMVSLNLHFMPRTPTSKVNCRKELDKNPFTNTPHSEKYKKLLRKRKELPAFVQMDEFYKVVRMMFDDVQTQERANLVQQKPDHDHSR